MSAERIAAFFVSPPGPLQLATIKHILSGSFYCVPRVETPHPLALPAIGTGIHLPEKGSAGAQAAAEDGFGRRNKTLISNQHLVATLLPY
jgi:hypothetical protein